MHEIVRQCGRGYIEIEMRQKRSGLYALGIVLLLALFVSGCKGVPRPVRRGSVGNPRRLASGNAPKSHQRIWKFHIQPERYFHCVGDPRPFLRLRLESGSGNWRVVNQGSRQFVQLDFRKIENWKGSLPFGTQLEISSKRLIYFIGDPDDGQVVVFEKK